MKKTSRSRLTTKYLIIFGAFFLMVNIVLGFVLHWQSTDLVQTLIRRSMLNVSNTAADQINGDVIRDFRKEDVGSEPYNEIYHNLTAFQENVNIEYIYAVRQVGPNKFVFTVDPDPKDPGEFGEEIVVTKALKRAAKGVPSVDNEPAADRWGNFYSAYSPIFDSQGKVTGIIGVDFSSAWYDGLVWRNTRFIIFISSMFALAGVVGFFLLSIRVRRRFDYLNGELAVLSSDVEELTREILNSPGYRGDPDKIQHADKAEAETVVEGDEIKTLGNRLHAMHTEMEAYLDYLHAQVNTDALTRVGNTTAYLERQKNIDAGILNNTAAFSAVMFDINDLKRINDRYGHAGGDKAIQAAASVIAEVYGNQNTFRVGGDEFIVIVEQVTEEELDESDERIKALVEEFNETKPDGEAMVSLSWGRATFVPGEDHSFRDVFVRADSLMYERKEVYHRSEGV